MSEPFKKNYAPRYIAEETESPKCDGCAFIEMNVGKCWCVCPEEFCNPKMRPDGKDVIFKLVPYTKESEENNGN